MATKQQQLTISISMINYTDYFGKGISIYFFCYNFPIVVQVTNEIDKTDNCPVTINYVNK
jgi:hypothetical protein